MIKIYRRLDRWLDRHIAILLFLFLMLILRLPNLFEPYWYGDEGMYLTIGNALRDGKILYLDIIDHKTPLIYYFAILPGQTYFRLAMIAWMGLATINFFHLAKTFFRRTPLIHLATLIFVLLTSLPALEGNIPNGELWVMGFALLGWRLALAAPAYRRLIENKSISQTSATQSKRWLFLSGVSFGLAILTKVPAVFDMAAVFIPVWLLICSALAKQKPSSLAAIGRQTWALIWPIILGTFTPIFFSIIYFAWRGAGGAYLDYGLLYNFRYVKSWGLPFHHPLLIFLFSLKGKIILTAIITILISLNRKKTVWQIAAIWLLFALFGATLSNRPYPHYLLQIVPPLALFIAAIFQKSPKPAKIAHYPLFLIGNASIVILLFAAITLLKFGFYPTIDYYRRFGQLLNRQITFDQYGQKFNPLAVDNQKAADIIRRSGVKQIFIWGTNPMLYALSQTYPVGRFTVSFHIKDFQAQKETVANLNANPPLFIVTMNDEREWLPGLDQLLENGYLPNYNFQHFILWKKFNNAAQLAF